MQMRNSTLRQCYTIQLTLLVLTRFSLPHAAPISAQRRVAARLAYGRVTWPSHLLSRTLQPVRPLFVVGETGHDGFAADELRVSGVQDVHVSGSHSTVGTVAVLLKLVAFLRYAARQPEEIVAVADDDTFISLIRLHSVAAVAASFSRNSGTHYFVAGHFEWYNLIPRGFQATGWGSGPQMAAYSGQRLANCTADRDQPAHGCIGPFAFASGTFLLLGRSVVRDLIEQSVWLARDAKRAAELGWHGWRPGRSDEERGIVNGGVRGGASSTATTIRHQVFHDVHLGLWLTQLTRRPGIVYVSLHQSEVGYMNVRGNGRYGAHGTPLLDGATLLAAHRLPSICWHNASLATRGTTELQMERVGLTHIQEVRKDRAEEKEEGEDSFAARVLPPLCTADEKAFTAWTLRPLEATTCVLRLRPAAPALAKPFECNSSQS